MRQICAICDIRVSSRTCRRPFSRKRRRRFPVERRASAALRGNGHERLFTVEEPLVNDRSIGAVSRHRQAGRAMSRDATRQWLRAMHAPGFLVS